MSNDEVDDGTGLAPYLIDFLEYRQLFLSVGQIPGSISWTNAAHANAIKRLSKVIREVIMIVFLVSDSFKQIFVANHVNVPGKRCCSYM